MKIENFEAAMNLQSAIVYILAHRKVLEIIVKIDRYLAILKKKNGTNRLKRKNLLIPNLGFIIKALKLRKY